MNLKELLAAATKTAQDILDRAKAENRDLTDAEAAEFDANIKKAEEYKNALDSIEANTLKLSAMSASGKSVDAGKADVDDIEGQEGRDLGQRFINGAAYKGFQKNLGELGMPHDIRLGKTRVGSMKEYFAAKAGNAIGTPIAQPQNLRLPAVDTVARPEITLLDVISRGTIGSDGFEYLQITSVTRNTAIVPENTGDDAADTQKPQSTFSTNLETAKVYDYADGYTVTNQLLRDDQALASFLQNEFDYSFQLKLADTLLNGTGTNGQPKGLLNTTGVQAGEWSKADDEARNIVIAIRKALTKLKHVGAAANAILVNPEDAEKIDLMEDVNKRFLGNGPFGVGPSTVWGRPIVESEQIEAGKIIVGDFTQLALLDRTGLTVEAFNQHKDYASRNLVYIRAELAAAQVVWRPANFVVLEGTTPAGK